MDTTNNISELMRDETPRERLARWAVAIGGSLAINAALLAIVNAAL